MRDAAFIRQNMSRKLLFPEIRDDGVRREIEENLLKIDHLIPSLYTLFKDLRYLEPAAKAVKALLPEPIKGTLWQDLRHLSTLPATASHSLEVQDSETSYSTALGGFNELFDLAVRQLFLCSLRYFAGPADVCSKKDMNPIKQTSNASKRFLGFKLMELARKLHFETHQQEEDDASHNPGETLLADMINSLPREIFKADMVIPRNLSTAFSEYLLNATISTDSSRLPSIHTNDVQTPLSRRCGRRCGGPLEDEDRLHLFLRKMHAPLKQSEKVGYDVSSFYVKRCIYLAFFGPAQIPEPSAWGGGFLDEAWFRLQQGEATMTDVLDSADQQRPRPRTAPRPDPGHTDLNLESEGFGVLTEVWSLYYTTKLILNKLGAC